MISLLSQIALPLLGSKNLTPVKILDKALWFTAFVIEGKCEIEVELNCGNKIGLNQALLQFQYVDQNIDESLYGLSKSHNANVGYYMYLETRAGSHKQRISLKMPFAHGQLLVGIRTWGALDSISLLELKGSTKTHASLTGSAVVILLSVDVEALPGRAPDRHVDRLMWGGDHSAEGHGIGRLEKIFNDRGVVGTFYVDFAACCLHGDNDISEAAQFLVSKGQDVQLHVHSEVLVRNQQWVHATDAIPTFALHSFSTAKRAIEYASEKYRKSLGKMPDIFRAGGLWWSTDSILATSAAGIAGASNVSPTRAFAPSSDIFRWENGLIELPVDFCLDPYIQNGCSDLRTDVARILANKTHKVISCYLHSWSLSPRTQDGYHLQHSRQYQNHLEEAISILKTLGSMGTSSSNYLTIASQVKNLLKVPLTWADQPLNVNISPIELNADKCSCNICGTYLFRTKLSSDVCPFCHLRTRHRILRSVLDRQVGDIFSGKKIIANHADPNELNVFFGNAAIVLNFDVRPLEYLNVVADVQDLSQIESGSFDVFYSIYVLNHVTDDHKALKEMRRVICEDGLAIIMVPFHENSSTRLHTDITQNYGKDALDKYGVGSYRYYGYADLSLMLRSYFEVTAHFGLDPVTGGQDAVFICRLRAE